MTCPFITSLSVNPKESNQMSPSSLLNSPSKVNLYLITSVGCLVLTS